jgi:hypothetical protein
VHYKRSKEFGIERAAVHIRNVSHDLCHGFSLIVICVGERKDPRKKNEGCGNIGKARFIMTNPEGLFCINPGSCG